MPDKTPGEPSTPAEAKIEAVIAKIADWQGRAPRYAFVPGGLNNMNWRVRVAGAAQDFIVKIPGEGSERFIDRVVANDAAVKAFAAGISPEVHYYLPDERVEVATFLDSVRTANNGDFLIPEVRVNAVRTLRAFHGVAPLSVTKTLFDMIDEHFRQVEEVGAPEPPDIAWMKYEYARARAALEASGLDLVPCMNDTVAANFLIGADNRVWLIDYDYASMNDRGYELALWFGEMFFTPAQEAELIEDYFGRLDQQALARIAVYKGLADIKWSTWAMIQHRTSEIDFDFFKYGHWKHMRARSLLHDPRWPGWLQQL
ncbi:MAG: choline kinase family protein [Rhodospirillales bacterium]